MDLFREVLARLKDCTMSVRKFALRLCRDMLIVCGWIFKVDIKQGDKFMSLQ